MAFDLSIRPHPHPYLEAGPAQAGRRKQQPGALCVFPHLLPYGEVTRLLVTEAISSPFMVSPPHLHLPSDLVTSALRSTSCVPKPYSSARERTGSAHFPSIKV